MNIKMARNSHLSTAESKKKLSKQAEQEQNHRYGDRFGRLSAGRRKGENGVKGAGNEKHNC